MTNEERTQALKLLEVAPRDWQQLADDPGKLLTKLILKEGLENLVLSRTAIKEKS